MTDRPNSPIRIPIHFVDSDKDAESMEMEDDVFEIDGDTVDVGDDEIALEAETESVDDAEAPAAEQRSVAIEPAEDDDPAPARAEAPAGKAAAPELSVEAFAEISRELRQKTEALDRLAAEKNDLYDKLLRKQAEFENFRKRSERETQDTYRRARADILSDLLPALDNFELAVRHSDTADAQSLREGIQLIYKQLTDILSRHGLEPIEADGKPFDPELHEAVAAEVKDDVDDHTVLEEFQRGYKLGDRLLRPARVKVSTQG